MFAKELVQDIEVIAGGALLLPESQHPRDLLCARLYRYCRSHLAGVEYEELEHLIFTSAYYIDDYTFIEQPRLAWTMLHRDCIDYVRKESKHNQFAKCRVQYDLAKHSSTTQEEPLVLNTPRLVLAALLAYVVEPGLLDPTTRLDIQDVWSDLSATDHYDLSCVAGGSYSNTQYKTCIRLCSSLLPSLTSI